MNYAYCTFVLTGENSFDFPELIFVSNSISLNQDANDILNGQSCHSVPDFRGLSVQTKLCVQIGPRVDIFGFDWR